MPKKKQPEAAELIANDLDNAATESVDERVKILRADNARLKSQLDKEIGGQKLLLEEVREAIGGAKIVCSIPKPPVKDSRGAMREEVAILHSSDFHCGYYHPHGKQAFSLEILRTRAGMVVDKFLATMRDRRRGAKIERMKWYMLGDMIDGENMRPGHGHSIEFPVINQALLHSPEILMGMLSRFLGEFDKIEIVAVPGNHGRNGPPNGDAHALTNWDRVCYHTMRLIAARTCGDRFADISWNLPIDRTESNQQDDWYAVDYVFDWCWLLVHGENLKGKGWGGIPFYGVERMARRYADIIDDPIDFVSMGHIHVDASIPANYRRVLVNGALESSTTYARKELVSASTPSQKAVFVDAAHGIVSEHTLFAHEGHAPSGTRIKESLLRRK